MARSQQQWRRGSQLLLVAAAVALVFLLAAGSAEACRAPKKVCSGSCVNLQTNKNHCSECGMVCPVGYPYKWGEAYCTGGKCYKRCKPGQIHDPVKGECHW